MFMRSRITSEKQQLFSTQNNVNCSRIVHEFKSIPYQQTLDLIERNATL